ncbi:MAG: hypothetical protein HYV06_07765 [Deltaproteobacteria bacterium]|nr:hypothetical protein [Deltaproteobacteria bacterium]
MKSIRTAMLGLIALAFASLVSSCGSSGGGTPASGSSATVSKGAIERFGSVVVNGVEFRVAGATLHLRDDNADKILQNETEIRNNLEEGMVITVKGRLDANGLTGAATEIEFRDALIGRIDDKGVDFIKVMGQTIVLDDNAKPQLTGLAINDNVRISGLVDDKGGLRATHIKRLDNAAEFEVKGFVSDFSGGTTMTLLLSPTATTGLSVNLSGAPLPAGGIKNGDFVEVKSAVSPADGVITAIRVELEDELKAAENEEVEVEGFVANLSDTGFMIGATQVAFNSATRFVNGVAADLATGMKVEAEGSIVNGILLAEKIVFKDNLRISALVSAVDPSGSGLTILGKSVTLPSMIEIRENGNAVAPAALAGRFVDLRGRLGADGLAITATRIDVKNNDPGEATLRAPVSAASAADNTLTIAGILVNTTGAEFKGNDAPHSVIAATQFFNSIVPNVTVVKVRWRPFTTTAAPASDVELEN